MKNFIIPQSPPIKGSKLETPNEQTIKKQPQLRRATFDYALKNGGEVTKQALFTIANSNNLEINDTTRVMTQLSPVIPNMYSSRMNWHLDHMPGTLTTYRKLVKDLIPGAIIVLSDNNTLPATEFIISGYIELPSNRVDEDLYPNDNIQINQSLTHGKLPWYDKVIQNQISNKNLQTSFIDQNTTYCYTSSNFHRPPEYKENEIDRIIWRLLIRVNTANEEFTQTIPISNRIITSKANQFNQFLRSNDTWKKIIVDSNGNKIS